MPEQHRSLGVRVQGVPELLLCGLPTVPVRCRLPDRGSVLHGVLLPDRDLHGSLHRRRAEDEMEKWRSCPAAHNVLGNDVDPGKGAAILLGGR